MTSSLSGARIGFLERRHPPWHRGSVTAQLVPRLRGRGARVDLVHAEEGGRRLDAKPPWDLVVLKSGSTAALHLAAAVEAHGVPCVNSSAATFIARDKLASTAILRHAGLPTPCSLLASLGPDQPVDGLADLVDRSWAVKSARSSQGKGLWITAGERLPALAATVPSGPYLLMELVEHSGDDLKVFVAGAWLSAIERAFPARTLAEKRGRPVLVPGEVATASREVGRRLGLTCFGCDFVCTPRGWTLVDVNAFPGYKGAADAPRALTAEIEKAVTGVTP